MLSAHGGDFDYQGVKLESFDADINFDPGAFQQPSKIDARLRKLSYRTRTFESVALTLSGPPSAYDVHLAVAATGARRRPRRRAAPTHTGCSAASSRRSRSPGARHCT